ncbi:hypothetical protein G6F22_015613 [Rhizopus arrhizus]|nr:hypothetical protein G6F22_015613 [Rhizopus arrhizus]KAG1392173.1 hypothetical protein G6F58_012569 [Rhizopus delemar]
MDELSAVYSNVNRESLTYNGKVYDHLLDVVKAQVKDLKEQLNLQDSCLPKDEKGFTVEALENGIVRREEQKEERQLLNSGESKLSGSLSDWGISFERIKVPLMITDMTIDLDKLVPRFAELGISVKKMAVEAWGGTRTKNIPDVTVLGAFLPVLEPIIRVGEPILYEKYKIYSEGGLLLASPTGGDLNDGKEIRRGFVHGILPPGPNGVGRNLCGRLERSRLGTMVKTIRS